MFGSTSQAGVAAAVAATAAAAEVVAAAAAAAEVVAAAVAAAAAEVVAAAVGAAVARCHLQPTSRGRAVECGPCLVPFAPAPAPNFGPLAPDPRTHSELAREARSPPGSVAAAAPPGGDVIK